MKAVFLNDDFPPQSFGGAGISTYELAAAVRDAGCEVSVITTVRKEEDAEVSEYGGLTVYKIASSYPERWRAWRSLYNPPVLRRVKEILKEIRPDVVHANNVHYHLSYASLQLAKRYAKAVVWTSRDVMAVSYRKIATSQYLERLDPRLTFGDLIRQAGKRYNPLRNILIRKYLAYADQKYSVSEALREALAVNGIKNVTVFRTGTNPSDYVVSPGEVSRFKEKYGLAGRQVLLFGGRLSATKGAGKMLEAMSVIAKEFPSAVLLVAGGVDEYAKLMQERAVQAGIGDALIFTEWISREEMKVAYAVASIVLVPSLCLDAFPRTVVEAMASGTSVIGTRYGGAPEIIEDGVTGYVVDPRDAQEIAVRVSDLLRLPEKAAAFGAAGRERIRKDFNIADRARELVARYQELSR